MFSPGPCFAIFSRSRTPRNPDSRARSGVISGKRDLLDRVHLDLAFFHAVSRGHLHVGPHPDADAARELSATNPSRSRLANTMRILLPRTTPRMSLARVRPAHSELQVDPALGAHLRRKLRLLAEVW